MNVIITGYYNKHNYGDDLFQLIAQHIFTKIPNINYKIVTISQLLAVSKNNDTHIVILFGGEVLNDFFLNQLIQLHEHNDKIIFKAIGVSCNQDYNTIVNKMQLFDTVIFRNKMDYNYFKNILTSQCYYCPDIVFCIKSPRIRYKNNLPCNKSVGFFLSQTAVSSLDDLDKLKYIKKILSFIRFWLSIGYKVKLFSMCTNYIEAENDNLLNADIFNRITRVEKLRVKWYKTNDVILNKFKKLSFAVCWRYHSHILSMIYNVPFISLSTTPKVRNFLSEAQLMDFYTNDYADFCAKSLNLVNNRSKIQKNLKNLYKNYNQLSQLYYKIKIYTQIVNKQTFYINTKTIENTRNAIIAAYKNPLPLISSNKDKAMFVLFMLLKDINSEYQYGLEEKIKKGITITELEQDINWLIYDCIMHGNKKFYRMFNRPSSGWINIHYISQNNCEGLHRAGWDYVFKSLEPYNDNTKVMCDLYLDRTFHWNCEELYKLNVIPYTKPWVGFIHHTFDVNYSSYNTVNLFKNSLFIDSLFCCRGLFVLSKHLKLQIEALMDTLSILNRPPIYVLTHPTEFVDDDKKFTMKKFNNNTDKKILQVGAWLRNLNAINQLNSPSLFKKTVLKGKLMDSYYASDNSINQVENNDDDVISRDITKLPVVLNDDINVLTYLDNDLYDKLFTENIIFINLIGASAVNTIIECIIRNTPIFVNRLPATEEALGESYPLFYNNIDEVHDMLTTSTITNVYNYLKNLYKDKFKIETFIDNLKSKLY